MKEKEAEPTPKSLVTLSAEYAALAARLMDSGGELTPQSEAELDAVLGALVAKTDGCGMVLDRLEQEAIFWKLQKEKCADAQRFVENNAERLRERMKFVLSQTEGEAMQGDLYRFFLSRTAPKLLIDEGTLDAKFKKTEIKVSPDREAIQAAINKGETPKGVTVQENKSLRSGRPK